MRCPDCNKFVGFDQLDPEVEADVEGSQVIGTVRLALACSECGGELKEVNIDFQEDIDHVCDPNNDDSDFTVTDTGGEVTDRFEGKGQRAKHFYGAELTIGIQCEDCQEKFDVTFAVEEQSSGFEELV